MIDRRKLLAMAGLAWLVATALAGDFTVGISGGIMQPSRVASLRNAEAESGRLFIRWNAVEESEGCFQMPVWVPQTVEWMQKDGIAPLVVLSGSPPVYNGEGYPVNERSREAFLSFAAFVGEWFENEGRWFEVWNEWNRGQDMPSGTPRGEPAPYVALLASVYPKFKDAHPEAIVLGGAMEGIGRLNDWTRRALDAGMLHYLDGLSFHPYVYWMNRRNRVPERGMLGLVRELEQLLAKYPKGSEIPLYITEIGWPTHEAREGVSLHQQADYLSRALMLLRANPRVRGVWIHTLMDHQGGGPDDLEAHFGLLYPDGSPKPAWFSFRDTVGLLKQIVQCRRIDFGADADALAGVEVEDAGGKYHLVIWSIEEESPQTVEFACRLTPLRANLDQVVIGSGGGPPISLSRQPSGESVGSITVGPAPRVIRNVGRHWRILRSFSSSN